MNSLYQPAADALKKWFTDYVNGFDLGREEWQQNIVLKKQHTRRVCAEIQRVGKALGLKTPQLLLAEVIALFHDLGRFEQYARYKTFVDAQSTDHAALSARILEEQQVLKDLDNATQHLIITAIRYHNRAAIPETGDQELLFYSRLLRDADKLDIYKVVTDYYSQPKQKRNGAIELNLPDTEGFSAAVFQELTHHQIVNIHHVQNLNDFKLLQLGWIFDINFPATLQLVKERAYLQKIRQALPASEQLDTVFSEILQVINNRLHTTA